MHQLHAPDLKRAALSRPCIADTGLLPCPAPCSGDSIFWLNRPTPEQKAERKRLRAAWRGAAQ